MGERARLPIGVEVYPLTLGRSDSRPRQGAGGYAGLKED